MPGEQCDGRARKESKGQQEMQEGTIAVKIGKSNANEEAVLAGE